MAKTGRSYQSKRSPSHMASEAARLREMIQERENALRAIRTMADEGRSSVRETAGTHILTDIMRKVDDALGRRGDAS